MADFPGAGGSIKEIGFLGGVYGADKEHNL